MQPPALGAGAPLTTVSYPVALPCGYLGPYSQMAASLKIYSITTSSLPGSFHQLHYLPRQLDQVQKPTFANCP